MTGTDLKLRRVAAHLRAKEVAAAAGWTSQRISQIEALHHVSPEHVSRYVAALATLTTNTTASDGQGAA